MGFISYMKSCHVCDMVNSMRCIVADSISKTTEKCGAAGGEHDQWMMHGGRAPPGAENRNLRWAPVFKFRMGGRQAGDRDAEG